MERGVVACTLGAIVKRINENLSVVKNMMQIQNSTMALNLIQKRIFESDYTFLETVFSFTDFHSKVSIKFLESMGLNY